MDCRPPGSSVHGIFQAKILEWAAIAFSVLISACVICYCPIDKSKSYDQVQRSCEKVLSKNMNRGAWTNWVHYCKQSTRVPATSLATNSSNSPGYFSFSLKWNSSNSHPVHVGFTIIFLPASPGFLRLCQCVCMKGKWCGREHLLSFLIFLHFLLSQNYWWIMVFTPLPVIDLSDLSLEALALRLPVNYKRGRVVLQGNYLEAFTLGKGSNLTFQVMGQNDIMWPLMWCCTEKGTTSHLQCS